MTIIIPIICIFVISFVCILILILKGEKDELLRDKRKIFPAIMTAFILALAPTVVITVVVFTLFGSTTLVNNLFSLNISINQLMFLTVSMLIYLYTIDSFISVLVEYIMGKNVFNNIVLLFIRIIAFYYLGSIFSLNYTSNLIISFVVAFIIFLYELLKFQYDIKEDNSE